MEVKFELELLELLLLDFEVQLVEFPAGCSSNNDDIYVPTVWKYSQYII